MRLRRLAVPLLAGLAALAALLVGTRHGAAARDAPPLPPEVLAGRRVDLAALRGAPAAVTFWASWCGPCRREAPALRQLARAVRGRARVVGVDAADEGPAARAFVARFGWTFPVLRDGHGTTARAYGVVGLPTTYVLDSRGRVARVLIGPQRAGSVRDVLLATR